MQLAYHKRVTQNLYLPFRIWYFSIKENCIQLKILKNYLKKAVKAGKTKKNKSSLHKTFCESTVYSEPLMWFCGQTGLLFCGYGLVCLLLWSADGLHDWFVWLWRGGIGVCLSAGLWVLDAVLSPVSPARRWHQPDHPWTPPSPACGLRPPPPLPRLLPLLVAQAWDLHLHAPPR